ncbi:MAG: hypothetical protein D6719_02110 [Candidatus Dadabacteria bacterium]|nr:MAG: hypothetical protein D6719_02110 [Candidatus Dadabacteria bacterium]
MQTGFYKVSLILTMTAWLATPVFAQDFSRPDSFFPQNYAAENLTDSQIKDTKKQPEAVRPEHKKAVADKKTVAPGTTESSFNKKPSKEKIPIIAISAVLNAADRQHFSEHLNELIDTAVTYDLAFGSIYAVGWNIFKHSSDLQNTAIKIIARGGEILDYGSVPDEYPVKLSPTWIIETEKGDIVLEATGPLRKYITSDGSFMATDDLQDKSDSKKDALQVF